MCVRASDIKEIMGVENVVEESHYDENAYRGFSHSFEHYKETHLILWDFKTLKVKESVDEIQNKISDSINTVNEVQTKILKEVFIG